MDASQLEDRIYECAFVPELWADVLGSLAGIADARGGVLVVGEPTKLRHWTASQGIAAVASEVFASGALLKSSRLTSSIQRPYAGFFRDNVAHPEQQFRDDALYRDHLWPAGLGCAVGTTFSMPTGETLFIAIERERARGPVSEAAVQQLDGLRPHIARSAYLAARQQLARAKDAVDLLERVGLGAVALSHELKVMAANDMAVALKAYLTWRSADRVALRDRHAHHLLQQALATIDRDGEPAARSFVLRGIDTHAAMVAHVLPLRGSALDIFARSAAVMVLTPVKMPEAPPLELIQSLFDLTATEARVARRIVTGETIAEIATGTRVSHHTVRTHLRHVLAKTGCRRQAEVASLLSGVRSFNGAPGQDAV